MIYYLECDGFVKIGYTKNSELNGRRGRLGNIQTGCPRPIYVLGTQEGTTADESLLHRAFDDNRSDSGGEWFRIAGAVRDHLEMLGMFNGAQARRGYRLDEVFTAVRWDKRGDPLRWVPVWLHTHWIRGMGPVDVNDRIASPPRHRASCFKYKGTWRCVPECKRSEFLGEVRLPAEAGY